MNISRLVATALFLGSPAVGHAQLTNSPAGGTLPAGVSVIGGVVADFIGTNGTRVVSQLAASQLYRGFSDEPENPLLGNAGGNPLTIGTQTGFTPSIMNGFGGGFARASFRFTLFDGDTGPFNFDFNENFLRLNGIGGTAYNWSNVVTQRTTNVGGLIGGTSMGFLDDQLQTGFFDVTNATDLSGIFTSMVNTGNLVYGLFDQDPVDNFFDFTLGVDASLINVGTGPVVTPPSNVVPEPSTYALMAVGMAGIFIARRKRVA